MNPENHGKHKSFESKNKNDSAPFTNYILDKINKNKTITKFHGTMAKTNFIDIKNKVLKPLMNQYVFGGLVAMKSMNFSNFEELVKSERFDADNTAKVIENFYVAFYGEKESAKKLVIGVKK